MDIQFKRHKYVKRGLLLLLLLIISLITSGCWNRRELNEIGIVIATAIDMDKNNQWLISYQVVVPESGLTTGGGSKSPVTVFSTSGKTLQDSVQNANLETPRTLFFAHNRVIIISESVAKKGVSQIVDYYLRHAESRETTDVVLTKGKASDLLEVLIPQEKIPGNAVYKLLEGEERNLSIVRMIKFHDFIAMLLDPTSNALLPEVDITGKQEKQTTLDSLKGTRSQAVMKIGGVGVFKRDKLLGWLNRRESIGMSWASGHIKSTVVVFPCEGTKDHQMSSFLVEKSTTKLKPKVSKGNLEMTVDIKANGTLNETGCHVNLKDPKTITKLEKQIQEQIKNDVEKSFKAAKKLKADIFGFNEAFHKKHPKVWKKYSENWDDTIADMNMVVKVDVNIRRIGLINQSFSNIETK